MTAWIQSLVFSFCVFIVASQNKQHVCFYKESKITCCKDYILRGQKCIACVGSYGLHCSQACPSGYCGRQCRTRCQCADCDSHNCTCSDACFGSYGDNCSQACPPGHCGRQCETRCQCDDCDSYNCTCSDGRRRRVFYLLTGIILPVFGVSMMIVIFWICRRYGILTNAKETDRHKINITVMDNIGADNCGGYATVRESRMV